MSTLATNYNGWTNYATWLINSEFFDGRELEDNEGTLEVYEISKILQQELEDYIDETTTPQVIKGWLQGSFVEEINFFEIAGHLKDDYLTENPEEVEEEAEEETTDSGGDYKTP